jgi:pilin isopeptide linkage protein
VFTNSYSADETDEVTLTATKTATGRALIAGFAFEVYDADDTLVAAGINDATGNITFTPALTFDSVGIYTYTIKEKASTFAGWTADGTSKTITVTVTDPGNGKLVATVSDDPTFTNTYEADETEPVTLTATKTATGRALIAGFAFEVVQDGDVIATGTNAADGTITFTPALTFTYDAAGTYTYTIRETSTDGGGWTVDKSTKTITVTVTDDGSGKLEANVTGNAPVFANSYSAEETDEAALPATETAIGRALIAGFAFEVVQDGDVIATGTNEIGRASSRERVSVRV